MIWCFRFLMFLQYPTTYSIIILSIEDMFFRIEYPQCVCAYSRMVYQYTCNILGRTVIARVYNSASLAANCNFFLLLVATITRDRTNCWLELLICREHSFLYRRAIVLPPNTAITQTLLLIIGLYKSSDLMKTSRSFLQCSGVNTHFLLDAIPRP